MCGTSRTKKIAPTGTMKKALSAPIVVAMIRTRRTGAVNDSHPTIQWPTVAEMTRTGSSGPSGTPAMSVIWRRLVRSSGVDANGSKRGRMRLSRRRQRHGSRAYHGHDKHGGGPLPWHVRVVAMDVAKQVRHDADPAGWDDGRGRREESEDDGRREDDERPSGHGRRDALGWRPCAHISQDMSEWD